MIVECGAFLGMRKPSSFIEESPSLTAREAFLFYLSSITSVITSARV